MRKLFKNKKALSPVVAAIILIAVTVAVSIAVAAWMGALTFTFMSTEQVAFTDCTYPSLATAELTIKNSGTSIITIDYILVNNQRETSATKLGLSLNPGEASTQTITASNYPAEAGIVSSNFVQGGNYAFTVVTSKNNQFGPYTKTAPS